ncbi:MAG: alkaline phosphatase family protein [Bacteroidota bacterium]
MTAQADDLLQGVFPDALTYKALRAQARLPDYDGAFGCVPAQSVGMFPQLALAALERWDQVVVLAVDAIPWSVYARHRHLFSAIVPVTSVVPSTSASAWTSVLRGGLPRQHGVHGVVMYDDRLQATTSILSNSVFQLDGTSYRGSLSSPFLDPGPSLFQRARRDHAAQCFMLGLYALEPDAILGQALAEDCEWTVEADYSRLLHDPAEMIERYQGRILDILARRGRAPTLVHAFLDFDTFLHETPYDDPRLDGYMEGVAALAQTLARQGACVLIVSDHGMVRQPENLPPCSINDPEIWRLSYARPGGAGRILFFYPRPGCEEDLQGRLHDLVGDTAWIMPRARYLAQFVDPAGEGVSGAERIGPLVAVARSAAFPSVMRDYTNEHGACSEDEMFVAAGIAAMPD